MQKFEYMGQAINLPIAYSDKDRYYHNANHIESMVNLFNDKYKEFFDYTQYSLIMFAIYYHDSFYVAGGHLNEEFSYDRFVFDVNQYGIKDWFSEEDFSFVKNLIMCTKTLKPTNDVEKLFLYLDWSIFDVSVNSYDKIIDYNYNIFKEFQSYNYEEFSKGRIQFLNNSILKVTEMFSDCSYLNENTVANMTDGIECAIANASTFKPSIGVYAGSFNPFHSGHFNVLEKAEKIFDKVVIVQAKNSDKSGDQESLPDFLNHRECIKSDKFIGDIIDSIKTGKESHFAMIRGIRTGQDLIAEQAYQETLKDLGCSDVFCFILCDAEFQHISSTMIRGARKLGLKSEKWLLPY